MENKPYTKILIFSDAHINGKPFPRPSHCSTVSRVINFIKPEYIINAGDMEDDLLNKKLIDQYKDKYLSVVGNWDEKELLGNINENDLFKEIEIKNWKICLTHGGHNRVISTQWPKYSHIWRFNKKENTFSPNKSKIDKFSDYDILILGHIHRQIHFLSDLKPKVIEPGSINWYCHRFYENYKNNLMVKDFLTVQNQRITGFKFGSFDVLYLYEDKAMLKEFSIIDQTVNLNKVTHPSEIMINEFKICWEDKMYWFKK